MKTKMMIYKRLPLRNLVHGFALVLLLFVQSLHTQVYCQCPTTTTEGTDFWVMFLNNSWSQTNGLSLFATGNNNAVITVVNPRTNWSTTANLTAGNYVSIPIPDSVCPTFTFNTVLNAGLHVTSTATISLYASNYRGASFDIATVFPTSSLRDKYMCQSYPVAPNYSPSNELGVVAIVDSTVVTIGSAGSVNLMRGQTYLYCSPDSLSGVEVTSNSKPFALFQGDMCTPVVNSYCCCDHLYEQVVPLSDWGQKFVVVPSAVRRGYGDVIRITSSQDSCDITINGVFVARNLRKGATYEALIPYTGAKIVETSKPCYTCLYLSSYDYGGDPGDPAAVTIPPVEQGVCEAHFAAYYTPASQYHYANIVTETSNVPNMTLDGNSIASSFVSLNANYSYAQQPVTPGSHNLRCTSGTFVAHFYGFGGYESYAYTAGMGLESLQAGLQINGWNVNFDTVRICLPDTLNVQLNTSNMDTSVRWYIDNQLTNINRVSFRHHFDTIGTHTIMALTHGQCDTAWCDTLMAVIEVFAPYADTLHAVICQGDTFHFRDSLYTTSGFYKHVISVGSVCDSVFALDLTVLAPPQLRIYRSGNFCRDSMVTLYAITNGNSITWTAAPPDPSLSGQEHNAIIHVSPQWYTEYSVMVDSVPRDSSCPTAGAIGVRTPVPVHAEFLMTPKEILLDNLQVKFMDITMGDIESRKWFFSESSSVGYGLTVYDEREVFYTPHSENDSLHVRLSVVNIDGCTDTTYQDYPIQKYALWVPNSFTPDGDFNTLFKVAAYNISDYEMFIYNREGLLVFHSTDLEESWDGTHNGKPCVQGSYVYVINYKTKLKSSSPMEKVGSVLLIR